MNVRQLEAFRAVVLTGSVTNAAALMGISQPAVSRLIALLEAGTRITLFDRVKNRLVPSHEARLLFEEVDRIFTAIGKIEAFAGDLQRGRKGHLTIAALPTLAQHFLPDVISAFRKERPEVTFSLVIRSSEKIQETTAAQQIDFGIVELPLTRTGFESEPFCDVDDVVVFPEGHRLASFARVPIDELATEAMVALTPSSLGRLHLNALFGQSGQERAFAIEVEQSAVLCRLVAGGAGVGVIDIFAAEASRLLGLDFRPLADSVPFRCAVLYPSFRSLSKPARDFLIMMRQARANRVKIVRT